LPAASASSRLRWHTRTAGDYLTARPRRILVLPAGCGHVLHDDGVPARLRRINPARQTVLVTDIGCMPATAQSDDVFAARELSLPAGEGARRCRAALIR
jgi:uncharacterized iron-regulated protein